MTAASGQPSRFKFGRVLINVFVVLVGAYGISVTLFLLLRLLLNEDNRLIETVNNFAHVLFMLSLVLIPLCLLLRRFRLVVLLIPPLLAFLISYAPLFIPSSTQADPDAPRLRVMTYNLRAQSANLDPLLAVIRDSGADVVALQELSQPAAERMSADLQAIYPHQALHPQPDPAYTGQGVLSRFPIESDDYWIIEYGHQRVALNVNDETVILYNTHPSPPFFVMQFFTSQDPTSRTREIQAVLERVRDDVAAAPLILAGDLNLTDQSADYRRVAAVLIDTHFEIGWGMGFTFPNFGVYNPSLAFLPPLARIDYVFHNERLQGVETRVMPDSGRSDHYPLSAVLALRPA